MNYLVDTNIISERIKKRPEDNVVTWLRMHESELYISAVSIGELSRGVERLPVAKKKEILLCTVSHDESA